MNGGRKPDRRTVLKGIGATVTGSAVFAGRASAGETGDNRRQDSFTWADDTLYEMLESEPHPPTKDAEGNDAAHRPLYLVGPQGGEHSPHFGGVDHVVSVAPGTFSAQWHVHSLMDFTGEDPTIATEDGLTNVDAVLSLADTEGFEIVPTEIVFTCPVRPHQHK